MAWPSRLVCSCLTTAKLRKFRARAAIWWSIELITSGSSIERPGFEYAGQYPQSLFVSSRSCLRLPAPDQLQCYLPGPTASLSLFDGLAPVIR
jgi:hypothetical protein